MKLYTGLDLHSSSSYLGIIDETGKRVFKQKDRHIGGQIFNSDNNVDDKELTP